jgi:hypothetical protein
MNWRLRAPCAKLPYDWWATGDDGNRLAMALCRIACPAPVRARCEVEVTEPAGIIRAGTAYTDRGRPCPTCPCGRPIVRRSTRPGACWMCAPTAPHIRLRRPGRPRRPASIS